MYYLKELHEFMGTYLGNMALLSIITIFLIYGLPQIYDDITKDASDFKDDIDDLLGKSKNGHF